jgi:diguanylate cyclase (GGDEF)-like protein
MSLMDTGGGWATEQLTEFLAAIAEVSEVDEAVSCAVERAAEAVDAEVAACIDETEVIASVGFPRDRVPCRQLYDVAHASRETTTELPGIGPCTTLAVSFDGIPGGRLLVARAGNEPFTLIERNLLRGMSRVLALSLRAIETIGNLRDRQALLEKLAHIQQSISLRLPLDSVLDSIVTGAAELLDVEIVAIRRMDKADPDTLEILAGVGFSDELSQVISRNAANLGAGGTAANEGRLVLFDDYPSDPAALPEFVAYGVRTAMAAPLHEDGVVVGSLVVASCRANRAFTPAEQETLLAFSDHASVALTDARTVQALRVSLEAAQHDALHDPLTRLPNRSLLRDRLDQAIRRNHRRPTTVAVLFLDLDGFKRVNDSLGHDAGDELLVAVAQRLHACIRDVDTLARLGGDEFALLLEDIESAESVYEVADRIHIALGTPFDLGVREITLTASIGVAFADSPEDGVRELLRNADLAMYQAKASGKGRYVRFHTGMHEEIIDRLELESALGRAIINDELVVHYQPIVDLDTDAISHFEALVRWDHPTRGRLMPNEFIPVAEATSLITLLGEQVLTQACMQVMDWQDPERTPVSVNVNLSPGEITPDLPERVAAVLDKTGLPAELLTLEITEGLLMDQDPMTLDALVLLRRMGVRLAVDDFGTGYSSLARLRSLPVDELKIDRSFVEAIIEPARGPALVRGVVSIAHGLGLTVVAEGVETEEQLQALRELRCREAQGYLLGRPTSADEITMMIRRGRTIGARPLPSYVQAPATARS